MCDYPFFIPQVVLFANSSLFWFKVTNEHREFRNYLSLKCSSALLQILSNILIQTCFSSVNPLKTFFANCFCALCPASMISSALSNKIISICFLLSLLCIFSTSPLFSNFFNEVETWDIVDFLIFTISALSTIYDIIPSEVNYIGN